MCKENHYIVYHQYLSFDFSYDDVRYTDKILLDEDTPNLYLMYDYHEIEITWVIEIYHKNKYIELNIVLNDDAYNEEMCGNVVASAWVCVYSSADKNHIIEAFEPNDWSYTDEADSSNNVSKSTFYKK